MREETEREKGREWMKGTGDKGRKKLKEKEENGLE